MSTAPRGFAGPDDTELVQRIQAGDATAFRDLYDVAHPILLRFAYHIVQSRDAAEDAVQHVFVTLWLNRSEWRPAGTVRGYLYRAVRNRVLDMLRHAQLITRSERIADTSEPYGMGTRSVATDAALETADRVRRLAAAVRRLPERQRTAVLLRWYDEMPVATVAEVMGVSRQAVEKLLRTAEGHLRTFIVKAGGP